MDKNELFTRIHHASDDDPQIHAAYKTGEDKGISFYLVVAEKIHESKDMLKIRYFALNHNNSANDTWMKNGVTARKGKELIERFAQDFQHFHNGVTGGNTSFYHDLTESEE